MFDTFNCKRKPVAFVQPAFEYEKSKEERN